MTEPADKNLGPPERRNLLWRFLQFSLRAIAPWYFRYRVRGQEQIPVRGAGIILANHQSYLDPLLIGLPLSRPVSNLARENLFRVPIIGWIVANTYVMPVDREGTGLAGLRETLRRLQLGFLVGVFPEGTRSADGVLGEFKPGFALLVRRGEAPIYPVGIAGAQHAYGKGMSFPRPKPIRVVFGPPLTVDELAPYKARGEEERLVALIRERVLQCQVEAEAWLHES